jgi:DNA-binding MarR family transcriptional regulator
VATVKSWDVAQQPDKEAARTLDNMIRLMQLLNDRIHGDLPVSHARVFLCVARKPGSSISHISEMAGLSLSGASRAIIQLSEMRRQLDGGPSLVRSSVNLMNRRERSVVLTPKGERLFQDLMNT